MKLFAGWNKETIQKVVTVAMFSAGAVYGITYYYTLRQAGLITEWKSEILTHREAIEEVEEIEVTARKQARHREQVQALLRGRGHRKLIGTDDLAVL